MTGGWGVANGDGYTIAQKTAARAGTDLPEELERAFAAAFSGPGWTPAVWAGFRRLWRLGLVDLGCDAGGSPAMTMTRQQSGCFLEARKDTSR